jgi:drug/metabolite transporter (DMT)-like permease
LTQAQDSGSALLTPQLSSADRLRTSLSFFAIYFVWGSTFLAIRILVETVPPLLAAGLRFVLAGAVLLAWTALRGVPLPSLNEWRNLSILGALMFLIAYGGLFWAEKTIASGVASVLVATIPLWTALFEVVVFKKNAFRTSLILALFLGIAGVAILVSNNPTGQVPLLACLAILGAEISWSFGTALSKGMALPSSKVVSSGGQMFSGGCLLLIFSALLGELSPLPHISLRAGLALAYLAVAGSILAFTAYVWLLGRFPASTVASYAYVNPVIALAIGYWLGGETLSFRTFFGAALTLVGVILLLQGSKAASVKRAVDE